MRRRGGSLARAARPRVAGLHRRARLLAADLRRAPVRGGGAPRRLPRASERGALALEHQPLRLARLPRRLRSARELALLRARLVRVRTRGDVLVLHVRAERAPRGGGGGGRGGGGTAASPDDGCSPGATGSLAIASGVAASFAPASLAWRARRAAACALSIWGLGIAGVGFRGGARSLLPAPDQPRVTSAPAPGVFPEPSPLPPASFAVGRSSNSPIAKGRRRVSPSASTSRNARAPPRAGGGGGREVGRRRKRLSAVKETRLKKCSRIAASGCLSEGGARNLNAATLRLERLERRRARRPRALPPRARAIESTRCGACSASSPIASRTRSTRVRLPRGCPQKKTLRRSRRSDLASAPLPAHAPRLPVALPPRRRRPRARSRRH